MYKDDSPILANSVLKEFIGGNIFEYLINLAVNDKNTFSERKIIFFEVDNFCQISLF